jgi:polyphenol oxidase
VSVEGPFALGEGAWGLFTSRAHGNLSSVSGEDAERGAERRARLRSALGLSRLVRGYQVHGAVVGRVHADPHWPGAKNGLGDGEDAQPCFQADGHAVGAPGIAAMVLVADCLPVLLAARGAVAALHAGWRGLATGVLEEGVRALRDVGGQGEVVAVIGPCASVCCYEAGEEVHAAFGDAHRQGRRIDLRAIACDRLLAAGVEEVRELEGCTICDERFFSYRREGMRAGRQVGLAWLGS